ncbi:MAG: sulfite exporter TauE/SafE family protein [Clostridia bacterium]|nr:sulfite exporter TauE/SafE family protein [Clostridia bacterium]
MIYFVSFLVTLAACMLGPICGMGGGIIIKPILDATGVMSVSTVTFLSGCTVISMSVWSMIKCFRHKESVIDLKNTTFLAIGAAGGGILGKMLFNYVASLFADRDMAGGVQACLMFIATLGAMLYTINRSRIKSRHIDGIIPSFVIGLGLGVFSSFLGIGGGPFNVVILYYFFDMPAKKAAQNSLYVIVFSQTASVLKSVMSGGVPAFNPVMLIGMVLCAIIATEIGRKINKKIDNSQATKLLEGAMVLIMMINLYNIWKFFF